MAKGRKRDKREDNSPSLTPSLLRPTAPLVSPLPSPSQTILREIEDRRTYHPLGEFRPARFRTGGPSRITVKDRPYNGRYKYADPHRNSRNIHLNSGTKAPVSFAVPDGTVVCVRRKQRKEVLFAKRRAGAKGRQRRHKRNLWTKVRCR